MEVRGRYYSCFVSDVDLVGDVSVGWTTAICSVRVCTTNPRIFIVDPTFFLCLPARQQRESPWFLYFSLQPRRRGKKNSRNRSPNDSPTQRCTK